MKTPFSIRNILFNLALCIVSITVVMLLLELTVKIFYPQSHYAFMSAPWGFRHVPNASISYYGERGEKGRPRGLVPIHYNSKGLRDYEYSYEKPVGTFRILVLGDSWAEDLGSYLENLHVKRLEKKLNALGGSVKFEVINAGQYAFDNAQELIFYKMEGRKYDPDLVLVFYSGDTADSKYVTLENGNLVLHSQTYTAMQKARRSVTAFLRHYSDLGSLVLDRMSSANWLSEIMIRLRLKEKNIYATFPKGHPAISGMVDKGIAEKVVYSSENTGFKDVDKEVYFELKRQVESSGGKLIFMSVAGLDPSTERILRYNGFFVLKANVDFEEMGRKRIEDINSGNYDKTLDSHRFGYKMNEAVAQQMMDFLKENKLIPETGK